VVFYRSAFAIIPVMVVYAWRGELAAWCAPSGRSARPAAAVIASPHVLQFRRAGAAAADRQLTPSRSPRPVQRRARRAGLKEGLRIYRWSAVTIDSSACWWVLSPHFSGDELTLVLASTASIAGVIYALAGSICNAGP